MEPTQDSKNIAAIMWLGSIFVGFIAPLVVYFLKTDDNFLRAHSVEALNWAITLLILSVISWVLVIILIGIVALWVLVLMNLIFSVLGAIAATKGALYRVPVCLRLIK